MKKVPKFNNEDDERNFWAISKTEYVDWRAATPRKLVQLKPFYTD